MPAITYAFITGRITIPGTDMGIRALVTATPLTDDNILVHDDRADWGSVAAETDANGNLPATFKLPTNGYPAGALWKFVVTPLEKKSTLRTWTLGVFNVTTSTTIQALLIAGGISVTAVDATMVQDVTALVAEAEAHAAEVQGVVATSAGIMDAALADPASAPSVRIAAKVDSGIASKKDIPGGLASLDADTGFVTDRLVGPRSLAPRGKGVVCFTWDDGYPSWASIADKADDLGQRHTFAVTTNRIGAADGVTASDIASWYARGHEIACHSVTHIGLSAAAVASRVAEFDNAKSALEAIVGAGKVTTFVYPYGSRSDTTDREAYGRFRRVLDYQAASPVDLDDRRAVFHIPRVQTSNLDVVREWIRLAATQPIVVVIAGHNPGGATFGGVADPLSLADAYAMLQFAYDLRVPCLTTDEVFAGGSMLLDPSFELGGISTAVWRSSGSGTSIVTVTPDLGIAGTKAAQITQVNTFGAGFRQQIPVTPGRSYTLSGRARITAGTITVGYTRAEIGTPSSYAGSLSADNLDASATVVAQSADVTATTWTRFSVSYVVPQGVRYLEARLVSRNEAGITAQFDHIHFGPTEFGSFG